MEDSIPCFLIIYWTKVFYTPRSAIPNIPNSPAISPSPSIKLTKEEDKSICIVIVGAVDDSVLLDTIDENMAQKTRISCSRGYPH